MKSLKIQCISAGDINGDGKKEILIVKKNYARALAIDAKGRLNIIDQFNTNVDDADLQKAIVTDLTGDGKPEIILYDRKNHFLIFLTRSKKGIYREYDRCDIPTLDLKSWQIVDLNHDGHKDLLVAGKERFGIIYSGQKKYDFKEIASFESHIKNAQYQHLAIADLNGNEKNELVLSEIKHKLLEIVGWHKKKLTSMMKFKIFEYTAIGARRKRQRLSGPREMIIIDINQDGRKDILLLIHDRVLLYLQ